jgi:hypothetical protein
MRGTYEIGSALSRKCTTENNFQMRTEAVTDVTRTIRTGRRIDLVDVAVCVAIVARLISALLMTPQTGSNDAI